jgi:hypothetical protein
MPGRKRFGREIGARKTVRGTGGEVLWGRRLDVESAADFGRMGGRGPRRPSLSGLRNRKALSRTSFVDVPPMPYTHRDQLGEKQR